MCNERHYLRFPFVYVPGSHVYFFIVIWGNCKVVFNFTI